MGYTAMEKVAGDDYSWSKCARSQIFFRDSPHVQSLAAMQDLMQSNRWQTDPLSKGSPWNAIMARGDMDPIAPSADGGIDGKVASLQSVTQV